MHADPMDQAGRSATPVSTAPRAGLRPAALPAALLAVLALVSGGCAGRVPPPAAAVERGDFRPPAPPAAAPDSLLVVSYNIAFGRNAAEAAAALRDDPRLGDLDILLLQEMDPAGTAVVARTLGLAYVYAVSYRHPHHHRPWGTAVLSRWPIVDVADVVLPHPAPFSANRRRAVAADLDVGGRRVRAVSVHLSTLVTPLEDRLEQARVLADSLAAGPLPVVVGGDFNSVSRYEENLLRRALRPGGLREARLPHGPTALGKGRLNRFFPDLELDHLFVRGLTARATGIARHVTASDHYPVWAVFTWETPAPGGTR